MKARAILAFSVLAVSLMPSAFANTGPANAVVTKIHEAKANCASERIQVDVQPVQIATRMASAIVTLSTPDGGSCFGQPGENNYLVAKKGGKWVHILAAEPGHIEVKQRGTVSDVVLHSVGQCKITYSWTGGSFRPQASKGCKGLMHPPSLTELTEMIGK